MLRKILEKPKITLKDYKRKNHHCIDRNTLLLARQEVHTWLEREETLWRQRSKALWLKEGNQNKKFFNTKASH